MTNVRDYLAIRCQFNEQFAVLDFPHIKEGEKQGPARTHKTKQN